LGWILKLSVEVDRDQNKAPIEIRIKRGRRKLKINEIYGSATDTYGFTVEGRRDDLPSLTDIFKIVDAKRLDRIGTIETINEVTLLKVLERIDLIKQIDSVQDVAYRLIPYGTEGVAYKQVAGTGAGWVDPTGDADPDGDWRDEAQAYDNNTGLGASTYADDLDGKWCGFLELTLAAAIRCNAIRWWVSAAFAEQGHDGRIIDIDVYKDGAWIHVAEITNYTEDAWVESSFSEGLCEKYRIRFYDPIGKIAIIYETDIYQVATGGGELIIQPEQTDETKLKGSMVYIPPSIVVAGQKLITSGGSAEKVSLDTALKNSCLIQARPQNTSTILIGNATTQNVVLNAGESCVVVCDNLNLVYIYSATTGEGVNYMGG